MKTQIIAEKTVENEKGTVLFAREIAPFLRPGATVLFYGDLGSGKTFLIREIVKVLGTEDMVSSPSFSIINQYAGKDFLINHVDLYRIKNERELINLGLEDYWQGPYINFIEWPQIVAQNLEWPHYRLDIKTSGISVTWRKFVFRNVDPGN